MHVPMRGNVLVRQERGIGPISFRRLLLAGGVGILAGMIVGRATTFIPGCLSAWITLAIVLILTHPKHGLPLALYLLRTARSLAVLSLRPGQAGFLPALAHALEVRADQAHLDATALYHTTAGPDQPLPLGGEIRFTTRFQAASRIKFTTQLPPLSPPSTETTGDSLS